MTPKDRLGEFSHVPDIFVSPYFWHREFELAGVGGRGGIKKKNEDSFRHQNYKILLWILSFPGHLACLGGCLKPTRTCGLHSDQHVALQRFPMLDVTLQKPSWGGSLPSPPLPRALWGKGGLRVKLGSKLAVCASSYLDHRDPLKGCKKLAQHL